MNTYTTGAPRYAAGAPKATYGAPMATTGARMPQSFAAPAYARPAATSSYMPQTYTTQAPTNSAIAGAATTTASYPVTSMPMQYAQPTYRQQAMPATAATYGTYGTPTVAASGIAQYAPQQTISGARTAMPITSFGATQIAAQRPVQYAAAPVQYVGGASQAQYVGGAAPANYLGGATMMAVSPSAFGAGQVIMQQAQGVVSDYVTVQPVTEVFVDSQGQVEYVQAEVVTETVVQQQGQEEQQPGPPRVVIVCTSADQMGDQPTGAWSEEITGPYYVFTQAGCEVYIASILGGQVPVDQGSLGENFVTENDRRFQEEGGFQLLDTAHPISEISPEAIDCVWLAGGHGACMDFEAGLAQFVTDAHAMGRPIGAVCHGVIGLLSAINQEGTPLLSGKQVTGFSNAEEEQVGLLDKVPFLIQQRMDEVSASYSCGEPWTEYAIRDGKIITGQNPQSSVRAAQLCIEAMMQP